MLGGERHVRGTRIADRRAHFHRQRGGEALRALEDQGMDAVEHRGARLRRGGRPGLEGAPRGAHRALDVGRAAERDLAERGFGGWAHHGEPVAALGQHPAAVDEETIQPAGLPQEVNGGVHCRVSLSRYQAPTSGRNQGLPKCPGIAGQSKSFQGLRSARPSMISAISVPISVAICVPWPL